VNDQQLPLQRFKVLDLTHARAGPTAVRHLADWGAQVIRVEQPPSVNAKEEVAGKRDGFDFQNLHRNKRSITLNLKSPEGKAIFFDLAKDADVIIENMRANVKHRLGIDYQSIRAINPRIVYGSISGFGQDGPYQDRPGVDQVVQGMGGLMSITGLPGQGPVRVGVPIVDITAGGFLAQAILIALLDREVTGEGRFVHTSLLEAQIALLDFQAARWLINGEVAGQAGNNHPTSTPTGVFPASDGFINIAGASQIIWERLSNTLGAPHFLTEPAYATSASRLKNRERLNDEIAAITKLKTIDEWVEVLNAAGVPCGPIYTIDRVFANAQVQHVGITRSVRHPQLGELSLVAQPMNIDGVSKDLRTATPALGEHTEQVLSELGYGEAEITNLREKAVI
jgi:formyl-CoA transferase